MLKFCEKLTKFSKVVAILNCSCYKHMQEMQNRHASKGADFRITESILFGKYRIISTLGTGNTSTVYLAEHLKLKVYRAIKCIPKDTAVSGFSLEAMLLKNLNHPGIPLIYDIEENDENLYIIEEYIQGESLEAFVLHHGNISQELIIELGIQLCDILEYLHHLTPYPILYQDLKPEHIIVCGKQLKLVDFGIASFFTGSGNNFQIYGTKEFAAPEVLSGHDATPLSDLYSLGKVLLYLIKTPSVNCSKHLQHTIQKACAASAADRYETVGLFRSMLQKELNIACHTALHLYKKIIVLGSKHGIGTTHFSISLTSFLNRSGCPSIYVEGTCSDSLRNLIRSCPSVKENDGICYYRHFQGIPNYGFGIAVSAPSDCIQIKDDGVISDTLPEYEPDTLLIFLMSSSEWDMEHTILAGKKLLLRENTLFICNYNHKKASRVYANALQKKVYSFPFDNDAFTDTAEKDKLFSTILSLERSKRRFLNFVRKNK